MRYKITGSESMNVLKFPSVWDVALRLGTRLTGPLSVPGPIHRASSTNAGISQIVTGGHIQTTMKSRRLYI